MKNTSAILFLLFVIICPKIHPKFNAWMLARDLMEGTVSEKFIDSLKKQELVALSNELRSWDQRLVGLRRGENNRVVQAYILLSAIGGGTITFISAPEGYAKMPIALLGAIGGLLTAATSAMTIFYFVRKYKIRRFLQKIDEALFLLEFGK